VLAIVVAAASAAACGGGRGAVKPDPSTVQLGACADPQRDGVVSARPRLSRADKDLDGDRRAETVIADRRLCTPEGNCYWNVFSASDGSCQRYVGTIEAAAIDRLRERGEDGYHDLRGWWRLSGGGRLLLQEYRFHQGGYRVVEALLCREQEDDRLLCAAEERAAP
jgi:hypothetical protein